MKLLQSILLLMTFSGSSVAGATSFNPQDFGSVRTLEVTNYDDISKVTVMFALHDKTNIKQILNGRLKHDNKRFVDKSLTCRVYRTERFGNADDAQYKNSENCWLAEADRPKQGSL